ncbi:MAG: ribosomal protein S18-alanine N-acetyltransferase [Chloroflexi bacterium]|nr:ribosomal protein S18-alanine N-acetyltransferase [Chloroflexota bacterium]
MVTEIRDEPFVVELMTLEDIPAVMAIEKTAFPIPWPEQAYRHELLENTNAYFIVVRLNQAGRSNGHVARRDIERIDRNAAPDPVGRLTRFSLLQRLARVPLKSVVGIRPVIGFAGMWMFVDEAHVSTIASHVSWRGHGVGELLLLSLLREAQQRNALFATLEVRVSNLVAQNLYRKYGFAEVGKRKHYYRDNGEDALIMTVENFREPIYNAQLDALERALRSRLRGAASK